MNTKSVEQAIQFATEKHRGQFRKGTERPYITHPLRVMEILKYDNCPETVIIAGILHDTLEDTKATPAEIETGFGKAVLDIVQTESEDKSKSWKERKTHTIEHLKTASLETKLVCCADKLSNLEEIITDYAACGEKLWERFNAPKENIKWYYTSICAALEDLSNYKLYKRYRNLCKEFFIDNTAGQILFDPYRTDIRFLPEIQKIGRFMIIIVLVFQWQIKPE